MPDQLQNENDVLTAVRRFLRSSIDHRDEAEAMSSVVEVTSHLSLTNLEVWEGKLRMELWEIDRFPPSRWKFWSISRRSVSWLDLCNGDGFRRELAFRALSERAPNGFFLTLALRRLNDWVPEVRAAAREHLPMIVERSDPNYVVDALWTTLSHFSTWARIGDAGRQVLVDLISLGDLAVALKSRIVSATSGPTATILAQIGRTPILDRWLDEIATSAIQPAVRAKAYRSQLKRRIVWVVGRRWVWTELKWCKGRFEPVLGERPLSPDRPFVEILRMALVDRSPFVRRLAGEFLIQQLSAIGDESVELAESLASDPSPSVAERGRFALAQLGKPHAN